MFGKIGKEGIWVISLVIVLTATAQAVRLAVLDQQIPLSSAPGTPTVGIDGSGNVHVAWEYQFANPGELYTARYDTIVGWGPKTLLDTSTIGDRIFNPALVVNENGYGLLAWTGQKGLYASTFLPGSGWQPPHVVDSGDSPFSTFVENHEVGIDSAGNGLLVWSNDNGDLLLSSQYTLSTDTWTDPEIIGDREMARGGFSLDVNSYGNAILVWEQWIFNPTLWTLFASYFIAGQGQGTGWQSPETIYISKSYHNAHVTLSDSGESLAAFVHNDSETFPNASLYAARFITGQGWHPAEGLSVDDPMLPRKPKVALNSSGDAVVVWYHGFDYKIAANRYLAGVGWQSKEVLRPYNLGDPTVLPPHINDRGNIVVVWEPIDPQALAPIEMRRFHPAQGWLGTEGLSCVGTEGVLWDFSFAINSNNKNVIVWNKVYVSTMDIFGCYGFVKAKAMPWLPFLLFDD